MRTSQFIVAAAVLITSSASAQTLQDAIKKMDNEQYESAASDFRTLISKEPNKGENYFYYGENFFRRDEIDSANVQYQKGSEVNATNPLNYVGLGKVLLNKGKEADAKAMFYKAATLGANKNTEVMRKVADAYINTEKGKNPDEAINQISNAIKLEPNNAENYIVYGDALLEKNPADGGPAIKQYQKAGELNPKSSKGLLRQGKLYQRARNYTLALDYYKKAIDLDPNFAPGYREIAEVYMLAGQNQKAIEYWKKYLELNNSAWARYRYMTAIFNTKQYQDAINEGENLLKGGFKNMYISRLLGYAYAEVGTKADTSIYSKGLRAINDFFNMAGPNFKYLPSDYKYKGVLLSKTGRDSLGVVELMKAIAIDTVANCELWGNVAQIWVKAKNYPKAIAAFERKKTCPNPKAFGAQDIFELGRAYYFAGNSKMKEAVNIKDPKAKSAKEAEATPFYVQADSNFARLIRQSPTFPAGYFWRGRSSSQLDPTSKDALAKPFYEKGLEVTKPEEKTTTYKTNVIEAYEYLGAYYFVVLKDENKAKEYFQMLKDIDPTNEKANKFLNPKKPGGK
jgi:tetratricopeptide (TPR) repeat protein